jgi:hypothetical protein
VISGIHAIFHTQHADEVRDFLANVLELPSINAGGSGYVIFAAPPTELAVHETDDEAEHELFLACGDIADVTARLSRRGIKTTPVRDQGWGLVTRLTLPGGDTISLYEPRHEHPQLRKATRTRKAKTKRRVTPRPAARSKGGSKAKAKSRTSPLRKRRQR